MSAGAGYRVGDHTVAMLAAGVRLHRDAVRQRTVLLAPERALALDEIAERIVEALDGERSLGRISDSLAHEFGASRTQVAGDVTAFVQELADRRMLEIFQ